jgi:hypothetical protein
MIGGLTFDYAHARVAARLSARPDDRLWTQLRSARSVAALVDAVRASPAAPIVSGIPSNGDPDAIELAFRQQLRARIAEVAGWSPEAWRAALLYTRHLLDLPALLQLLSEEPPPRWIRSDPELAAYASDSPAQRRAALLAGPLAPLLVAIERSSDPRSTPESLARAIRRLAVKSRTHGALAAWQSEWRRRWPRANTDERTALEQLGAMIQAHVARFPALPVDETANARQSLAARLATAVRRWAGQPAALFAYLALFAIDLERLRGEFVLRARPLGHPQAANA